MITRFVAEGSRSVSRLCLTLRVRSRVGDWEEEYHAWIGSKTQCHQPSWYRLPSSAAMDSVHWVNCEQREKGGLAYRNKNCLIFQKRFHEGSIGHSSTMHDKRGIQFISILRFNFALEKILPRAMKVKILEK